MPFQPAFAEWVKANSDVCFCCGLKKEELGYVEVHSLLGFHCVPTKLDNPSRDAYLITSPPPEYWYMEGVVIEVSQYGLGYRDKGDAVIVCKDCHKEIHATALGICRDMISSFSGSTSTPKILLEAALLVRADNFDQYHFVNNVKRRK